LVGNRLVPFGQVRQLVALAKQVLQLALQAEQLPVVSIKVPSGQTETHGLFVSALFKMKEDEHVKQFVILQVAQFQVALHGTQVLLVALTG
jgi:hypothetical protein